MELLAIGPLTPAPVRVAAEPERGRRIEQLDGVRAVAITAVFLHHAFHVRLLWAGVDLFFILSGFLITGILMNRRRSSLRDYFGHFYGRRVRRIVPPYLLFLGVASVFVGISWLRHWYLYFFLMNLFMPFGIRRPEAFTVLWSLAVEEQFYFFWPFVVFLLNEEMLAWVAGAVVVAVPVLRWFCTPFFKYEWAIYMLTPFRMDLLAMGALLAVFWRSRRTWFSRYGHYGLLLSLGAVATLVACEAHYGLTTQGNTQLGNVVIYECSLVASTGFILWALSGRSVGILKWEPVRYLGRISYTVYLVHLLALEVAARWLRQPALAASAAVAVSLVYAALSWKFLEQPILGGRSRAQRAIVPRN